MPELIFGTKILKMCNLFVFQRIILCKIIIPDFYLLFLIDIDSINLLFD
jgi:hypothetical protein